MTVKGIGTFEIGRDPNLCEELVKTIKKVLLLPKPDLYITVSDCGGHDLLHVYDDEVQAAPIYEPLGSYEVELTEGEKNFFGNQGIMY